jgi:hypothetical protein
MASPNKDSTAPPPPPDVEAGGKGAVGEQPVEFGLLAGGAELASSSASEDAKSSGYGRQSQQVHFARALDVPHDEEEGAAERGLGRAGGAGLEGNEQEAAALGEEDLAAERAAAEAAAETSELVAATGGDPLPPGAQQDMIRYTMARGDQPVIFAFKDHFSLLVPSSRIRYREKQSGSRVTPAGDSQFVLEETYDPKDGHQVSIRQLHDTSEGVRFLRILYAIGTTACCTNSRKSGISLTHSCCCLDCANQLSP